MACLVLSGFPLGFLVHLMELLGRGSCELGHKHPQITAEGTGEERRVRVRRPREKEGGKETKREGGRGEEGEKGGGGEW